LHHVSLHDGVDESHFFGQLLGSERVLDGDVLLVVVEQSLESGEGWLGKVGKWVADDNSADSKMTLKLKRSFQCEI
jgi:hypothetical protein